MTQYRLHFLNADKSTGRGHVVECENDRDAIRQVKALHHAHGVDVWDGHRKVTRVAGALGVRVKR